MKNIKEIEEQKTLNDIQANPGKNYVQLSSSQLLEKERELREKRPLIRIESDAAEENKELQGNILNQFLLHLNVFMTTKI